MLECDKSKYRTRKGTIAFNVLGVCDQNMNFIYMLASWEESAADSHILKSVLLKEVGGLRVRRG